MAAIDMALWDAQAKAAGLPLVRLLGGRPHAVDTYASLLSMKPAAVAADAEAALKLGFRAFKVKLGTGDLDADLKAVCAVREVIGPECELMVDYNQALTIEEAIERIRILDREPLVWVEEPTRADDYAGHARIAAAVETAIQLGESWWGPRDMEKSIAAGASQHAMFDAMKIGGVSGWLRAARLAETAALPVSTHVFPEISAHLLAVTPTGWRQADPAPPRLASRGPMARAGPRVRRVSGGNIHRRRRRRSALLVTAPSAPSPPAPARLPPATRAFPSPVGRSTDPAEASAACQPNCDEPGPPLPRRPAKAGVYPSWR
jgi:L-alanine-DL-glutamate epimerase-like enolase superfamily enzyme